MIRHMICQLRVQAPAALTRTLHDNINKTLHPPVCVQNCFIVITHHIVSKAALAESHKIDVCAQCLAIAQRAVLRSGTTNEEGTAAENGSRAITRQHSSKPPGTRKLLVILHGKRIDDDQIREAITTLKKEGHQVRQQSQPLYVSCIIPLSGVC